MRTMTIHPAVPNHAVMAFPNYSEIEDDAAAFVEEVADLVDDMLDCFADWRDSAATVADAYRRWCTAPAIEEPQWFSAYISALDQEEATATGYAAAVADVERYWRRGEE